MNVVCSFMTLNDLSMYVYCMQLETLLAWALHGDGMHKLHYGKWLLLTFGTHCLRYDGYHGEITHSFRPLIYLLTKDHESTASIAFGMVALQMVAVKYTGDRLYPTVNISDFSNGLRTGMQYIGWDINNPSVPCESTPHMGDWAHLAVKFTGGKIMAKSNPYFGQVWCYIRAIHLTHSREQQLRMIDLLKFTMLDWEGMMCYDFI